MPTLLNAVKAILSNPEVQFVLRAAAAEGLRVVVRRHFGGDDAR